MANYILREAELIRISMRLADAFNPSGPIGSRDLFAGRLEQIRRLVSAISQKGQHVVLYGERGVGKTSLASLLHEFWSESTKDVTSIFPCRYNCGPSDTFASVWANIAESINDLFEKKGLPIPNGESRTELFAAIQNGEATPHAVRRFLDLSDKTFIVVIDEFDQIQDRDKTIPLFSATIKALSDHLVDTTLVLVGVADTIDDLIAEHASIDRTIAQVLLPRMSTDELGSIIEKGYKTAGLAVLSDVTDVMAHLAQGLPHYAHRLGQESGYAALGRKSTTVERQDVDVAVRKTLELTDESIRSAYHRATTSPQKDSLFAKVLLGCALAELDDLGYFAAADVRDPLAEVTKRKYEIPTFVGHLRKFCSKDKGPILQSVGEEWKRRYRFINPLMRPYLVLRGIEDRTISDEMWERIKLQHRKRPDEGGRQLPLI